MSNKEMATMRKIGAARLRRRSEFLISTTAAVSAVTSSAFPTPVRANVPPVVTSTPSADTRAATVQLDLQLIRTDVTEGGSGGVPTTAVSAAPQTGPGTVTAAPAGLATAASPATVTLAAPKMTTLDGSTASISVTGGDLSYTLSISPTIGVAGKLLILWNIRLSGKSLPGATGVAATGAVRIEVGKSAGIAEISLTDPTTGRRSTFRLQGIATVEPAGAAMASPAPATTVTATAVSRSSSR